MGGRRCLSLLGAILAICSVFLFFMYGKLEPVSSLRGGEAAMFATLPTVLTVVWLQWAYHVWVVARGPPRALWVGIASTAIGLLGVVVCVQITLGYFSDLSECTVTWAPAGPSQGSKP
jgi:bacteriorhodopsin